MQEYDKYPDVQCIKNIEEILGIGLSTAYYLANSGTFHKIRIDPLIKIPKSNLFEWLRGKHW